MASAVDSRLAYARLSAVATASRLPTANRGSNNSYTTSWDTTLHPGWSDQLLARRPTNVVLVAMANKTARVAWALLRYERIYEPTRA